MSDLQFDESILITLSEEDRSLINELALKIKTNEALLDSLCEFVKKQVEAETWAHFSDMSNETKFQACLGNIVIHLLSGKISRSDIKKLVK